MRLKFDDPHVALAVLAVLAVLARDLEVKGSIPAA
jgi:hypothetical protein